VGVEVGLGEVEQHVAEPDREFAEPVGVAVEEVGDAAVAAVGAGGGERLPDAVGHRRQSFSWLASRASASIRSQRPSRIIAAFATQEPPTQTTFGSAR
jgi:hypothetical protein